MPEIRRVAEESWRRTYRDVLSPAEIFRLYVEPGQWRRGIGSRLLGALESRLREEGEESVILYVHRENQIGLSFWRKHGFRRHPEGDREDDPCEACMRKELGTG